MANFTGVSDAELERELERRAQERRDAAKNARIKRINSLLRALALEAREESPRLIDALAPKHSCTSCSDRNPQNGYIDNGAARCPRCFLLVAAADNYIDEDVEFEFAVRQIRD